MVRLTRWRFVGTLVAGVSQACPMSPAEAQAPLEPGRITGGLPAGLFYRVEVAVVGPRPRRTARSDRPARLHDRGRAGRPVGGRRGLERVYMFDANGRFSFGTLGGGGLTGTYQLQGFALTLTFADGDTRRRTLFVASAGEPVGLISVEGEVYTRK